MKLEVISIVIPLDTIPVEPIVPFAATVTASSKSKVTKSHGSGVPFVAFATVTGDGSVSPSAYTK